LEARSSDCKLYWLTRLEPSGSCKPHTFKVQAMDCLTIVQTNMQRVQKAKNDVVADL
jgi:hypothetical protein